MQLKEWDMENEGENRAQEKKAGCFDKQLWKADEQHCRCLHVTMGVGHIFIDSSNLAHFLWETSSTRLLPVCPGCLRKAGRLHSALDPSQGSTCEGTGKV